MIIVDTSVWIDYWAATINPETEWLDAAMGHQPLAITDLILCELLQGIRSDAALKQVRRELSNFPVVSSGGEQLAIAAAQNYRALRARGITVRTTIDCLIATVCIREGHTLLHRDRDFNPFEKHLGLRVIHSRSRAGQ